MNYPQIFLKKGKELSILRKHPWVFSGAIQRIDQNIADGDLIEVLAYDGSFLGIGHFQQAGSISVRIISFSNLQINQDFWNNIILNAINYRRRISLPSSTTNAYRLIHGEGDGLPGLIVDIYNDIAVIQCHSNGIHKSADQIGKAISKLMSETINTIYVRTKETLPDHYDQENENEFLIGNNEETIITENNIRFKINVVTGQKTGFFLDQRDNRALLGEYSTAKSVLNCFSYTGGFSMYALALGALEVDSVDISQKAVDLMNENAGLINFDGKHTSICGNVMQYLGDPSVKKYDVVIIDPPAFAKSIHKRHNAVQAYKRLNVLAMKKVTSGGLLFTFSCSQVVGTQLFFDTIVAAGIEADKKVRLVKNLSQGPDHPINLFHPEGHYLKGLLLYIE